jgi:hypothetical protein
MRRLASLLLLAVFSLCTTSFSQTNNGCKLKFTGRHCFKAGDMRSIDVVATLELK